MAWGPVPAVFRGLSGSGGLRVRLRHPPHRCLVRCAWRPDRPEPSQGDLFDSNIYNIGGKLGLHIDENQRIQLAVSHYDARQDSDYATDPSVAKLPAGSVPANAIKGLDLDEQNRIRNTLVNLEYENLDILGSRLSAQMYYRDYFTRFTPFDARAVATRGGNVDQIMQNSEVFGSRLTLRTPLGESGSTELVGWRL